MITQKNKEKKHRLKLSEYYGLVRASFTICTQKRQVVFVNSEVINVFIGMLLISCRQHLCKNLVFIFMPDHLHLVLEGINKNSNLWKAIVLFKQKTGYWFSKNMPKIKWQKDFYDHIHRSESELITHVLYMLNNPVRKKMVENWQDYPFKGSLDDDLNRMLL
jgi:putative transposase